MEPMSRCRECKIMFLRADEAPLGGINLRFCPWCGEGHHAFDEVPDYFEVTWYWQCIEAGFTTRERVALKLLAIRSID